MNDTGAGSPHLVSTEWLASRLGQPGMVIVDGSWYLPTLNRDPRKEYLAEHIPGAVFFDLDATSDQPVAQSRKLFRNQRLIKHTR